MTRQPFGLFAATALALSLACGPLHAQLPSMSDVDRSSNARSARPLPKWDVAVVKPHPADDHSMSWMMNGDSISLRNLSLDNMICSAWDIKPFQLSGASGWMQNMPFDLTAKVSAEDLAAFKALSTAERREMLQQLLIERFHLKVHTETKTMPLYDLVVDKSGSKLKPTTAIDAPNDEERRANPDKYKKGSMTMGPGRYDGTGVAVRGLASQLSNAVSKPVRDATGLTGFYDITLRYRPEEATSDSTDAPSIFTAVQDQLGLRLVPSRGPVETLVVDSAEKPETD